MPSLDFPSVLLIAVALSADCFAVALGGSVSLRTFTRAQVLRVSLAFGVSQALMAVLGWLAGQTTMGLISSFDHWVAFALLAVVGGKMVWESFHPMDRRGGGADITKGLLLLTLAAATSIDALAAGLTFAFLEVNIALAISTIGIVAAVATTSGFIAGRRAGWLAGKRAEAVGGIILIAIGIRIVAAHVMWA